MKIRQVQQFSPDARNASQLVSQYDNIPFVIDSFLHSKELSAFQFL